MLPDLPINAGTFDGTRTHLLRKQWTDGIGWNRTTEEPMLLAVAPSSIRPSSEFSTHQVFELPDHPPAASEHSSAVHHFALRADVAATLNEQLAHVAHGLYALPRRWADGESKSNRGGYHSSEEALIGGDHSGSPWYDALLMQVLLPALRSISTSAAMPAARDTPELSSDVQYSDAELAAAAAYARSGGDLDANGLPTGGRITGWLNVNEPFDFNELHDHGVETAWSMVYYVQSGEEMHAETEERIDLNDLLGAVDCLLAGDPEDGVACAQAPAAAAAEDEDFAGALLLKTHPNPETHANGFMPVRPAAGELWCFPGHLPHAVMPRQLLHAAGCGAAPVLCREGLRISVACNVYTTSTPLRDEAIGYRLVRYRTAQ